MFVPDCVSISTYTVLEYSTYTVLVLVYKPARMDRVDTSIVIYVKYVWHVLVLVDYRVYILCYCYICQIHMEYMYCVFVIYVKYIYDV